MLRKALQAVVAAHQKVWWLDSALRIPGKARAEVQAVLLREDSASHITSRPLEAARQCDPRSTLQPAASRIPLESLLEKAGCAPQVAQTLLKARCNSAALVSLAACGNQDAFVTSLTGMVSEFGGLKEWELAIIYGQITLRLANIAHLQDVF